MRSGTLCYAPAVIDNALLAEALFELAESHPAGEERLELLRAAYAVFDHPRELAGSRRLPEAVPMETLPTVTMLRTARTPEALAAAVQRLAGPLERRGGASREGFLSAAEAARVLEAGDLDPRQLRGACHWHTRASDGAATLETMARACLRRGPSWAVVADHTRGLACVNGLDAEGVAMQRGAVAAWNRRRGDDLWMIQGLEVEIDEDGALDLPRRDRAGIAVIAAVHTGLTDRRDQTSRYLKALSEPGVWALAHPRGRLFARRSGVRANWEVVFRAAAAAGVLLEINGFPRRQDLDPTLVGLAAESGCRFLLASDAHHPRHLVFEETAAAIAASAGAARDRIVNFDTRYRISQAYPALGVE